MRTGMHVLKPVETRLRSPLWSAYEHFRLERQGSLGSPNTLHWYDSLLTPFFEWVDREHPEVRSFADLDVSMVRTYRAEYATAITKLGRQRSPESVRSTHKALMAFLRWAEGEGHQVDPASSASRARASLRWRRPSSTSRSRSGSSTPATPMCRRRS